MTPLAAMGAPRSTVPRMPSWHNSADQGFDKYREAVA
jgi:hypothetical protein